MCVRDAKLLTPHVMSLKDDHLSICLSVATHCSQSKTNTLMQTLAYVDSGLVYLWMLIRRHSVNYEASIYY